MQIGMGLGIDRVRWTGANVWSITPGNTQLTVNRAPSFTGSWVIVIGDGQATATSYPEVL